MPDFPIIRLEVDRMRHSIMTAFSEYQLQFDSDLKHAIEQYCTPDNLQQVLRAAVTRTLDGAIKEEVEKFFRYGEGRKVVADAVKQAILSNKTFTPLDDV
jgi:DNA polymerase III delta subunit